MDDDGGDGEVGVWILEVRGVGELGPREVGGIVVLVRG